MSPITDARTRAERKLSDLVGLYFFHFIPGTPFQGLVAKGASALRPVADPSGRCPVVPRLYNRSCIYQESSCKLLSLPISWETLPSVVPVTPKVLCDVGSNTDWRYQVEEDHRAQGCSLLTLKHYSD